MMDFVLKMIMILVIEHRTSPHDPTYPCRPSNTHLYQVYSLSTWSLDIYALKIHCSCRYFLYTVGISVPTTLSGGACQTLSTLWVEVLICFVPVQPFTPYHKPVTLVIITFAMVKVYHHLPSMAMTILHTRSGFSLLRAKKNPACSSLPS